MKSMESDARRAALILAGYHWRNVSFHLVSATALVDAAGGVVGEVFPYEDAGCVEGWAARWIVRGAFGERWFPTEDAAMAAIERLALGEQDG
jgi:hypothetical protein